jgi:hypothetical protein
MTCCNRAVVLGRKMMILLVDRSRSPARLAVNVQNIDVVAFVMAIGFSADGEQALELGYTLFAAQGKKGFDAMAAAAAEQTTEHIAVAAGDLGQIAVGTALRPALGTVDNGVAAEMVAEEPWDTLVVASEPVLMGGCTVMTVAVQLVQMGSIV